MQMLNHSSKLKSLPFLFWAAIICFCSTPSNAKELGFDWDKWAAAVNESPCKWLSEAQIKTLLGTDVVNKSHNSRDSQSCQWNSADGTLLVTLGVRSFSTPDPVLAEKNGQLNQINNYASKRFEQIPSESGVTTNIIRKDKLQVFMFPNDAKETVYMVIQGHPNVRENAEQKAARKERTKKVAQTIIENFKF